MEVSSLLVVVHRDLGESQSSSDAFRDPSPVFPRCAGSWELSISPISENDGWGQEEWWGGRERIGATARSPQPSKADE